MIELVLRITLSLLIVLGLMWGLARLARRPLSGRGGAALAVISRQQLTRGSSVALLRVVDRALVVGITDNQVTLLAETDLASVERHLQEPAEQRSAVEVAPGDPVAPVTPGRLDGSILSPATWSRTVNFLRERTVRR
ncbi:flagellar protein FliO/FliZ [Micromonospora pattaloongensis]|uniref:Flagellar protein FliO/FliZ n=1 Tax=Micromonospora pattaloongensis TaxID=405436 RepID=A0A1H3MYC8_9ACTN|nr:flagellar biosynthetic protein FliO [Micromonospora pattaloongensis]SDY81538.1 flagellar protein FliO/FliZ [Micromonospora pattaloongensis]